MTPPLHFGFTNQPYYAHYDGIKRCEVSTLPGKSVCVVTEAHGMGVTHLS